MNQTCARDPVARMDEIVRELSSLYSEADQLLHAYIDRVCQNAGIPKDIVQHHPRKKLMPHDQSSA
jgi:hypothetical protein